MMQYLLQTLDTAIVYLVFICLFLWLAAWVIRWYFQFSQQLRYLNKEIRRTRGAERKLWKRRRRRLWLSLLPFFRA